MNPIGSPDCSTARMKIQKSDGLIEIVGRQYRSSGGPWIKTSGWTRAIAEAANTCGDFDHASGYEYEDEVKAFRRPEFEAKLAAHFKEQETSQRGR